MVCTRAKGWSWGELAVHLHHGHRQNRGIVVLQKMEVNQKATTFSQASLFYSIKFKARESGQPVAQLPGVPPSPPPSLPLWAPCGVILCEDPVQM